MQRLSETEPKKKKCLSFPRQAFQIIIFLFAYKHYILFKGQIWKEPEKQKWFGLKHTIFCLHISGGFANCFWRVL
jgi:hypothetical protein